MGQLPFERIPKEYLTRQELPLQTLKEKDIQTLITNGIINLDKPSGPTSHQVSAYVKQILELDKTGHSGTLDPAVTGILPVALSKATRIVQTLLSAGKEYVCLMKTHKEYTTPQIQTALKAFTGKITQLPPQKSAVKRQHRKRHVYYIELLDHQGTNVLFRIGCQAGTYIRKICHDIGIHLGSGAHMQELRRTKAGPFTEDTNLATLHDLKDAYEHYKQTQDETDLRKCIQPIETAVGHLAHIVITDSAIETICQGASLKTPGVAKVHSNIQVGEPVAIITLKGELVAVAEAKMISKDIQTKERGIAAKSTQVFMRPGTYAKANLGLSNHKKG